nr:unnamed protein product [Spirometra erinaceieuropaei]
MTYVEGSKSKCCCGASEEEHFFLSQLGQSPIHDKTSAEKWSDDLIVNQGPTNAFGTIKFIKDSIDTRKTAQYVRIADTDDIHNVKVLFLKYWKLLEPRQPLLCLSIIGGAKGFRLDGKKRETFCKGLITAAQITNAWILTSGLNLGIVSVVGDAVQEAHSHHFEKKTAASHLNCIGISPWGYTLNRHQLINGDTRNEVKEYPIVDELKSGQPVSLNENHTHYLFVDEGYRNSFIRSHAMNVRAILEELISRPEFEGGLGIPVIQIIVEGGYDVLVQARNSVEHNIPIVVCSGTGRAANLLDAAIRFRGQDEAFEDFTPSQKKRLAKILEGLTDKEKAKSAEKGFELLLQIVQKPSLLNTVDLGQSTDLDGAILYALIKTSAEPFDQIHIALKFDRVDIVRENALDKRFTARKGQLEFLMNLALVENKADFVELMLEMGLDVNRFLNRIRLRYLYNNTNEADVLRTCLKACNLPLQDISLRKRNLVASGLVEKTVDPLAEMAMGPNSSSKLFVLSTVAKKLRRKPREDWICLRTVGRLLQEMVGCSFPDVYVDELAPFQRKVLAHPYRELFIWAVFFDRPKMVALFWRLAREPVSLGLIGCNLYDKIAKYLPLYDTDGRLRMQTQKLQMEAAIVRVLDRCYEASHVLVEIFVALICLCKNQARKGVTDDIVREVKEDIDRQVEYMQRWAALKIAEEKENSTLKSVEGRLNSIQTTIDKLSERVGHTGAGDAASEDPEDEDLDQNLMPPRLVQELEGLNERMEHLERVMINSMKRFEQSLGKQGRTSVG